MAKFIQPIVDQTVKSLQDRTLVLISPRDQFAEIGRQFSGVVMNFPACYVMPVRTVFDADSDHTRHQAHQIQIRLAVTGPTPEAVTEAAMFYMRVVDQAISESDPEDWQGILQGGQVQRVWIQGHDYGPLFDQGGRHARFPELELIVETEEV